MKKIIFFIILSEVLFCLNIERNKNSIIPHFLRLDTNETLLTLKTSYDTLTHKTSFSAHLHLYIRLFSKKITKTKNFNNNTQKHIYTYQYKSKLGIRLRNKVPSVEYKNSFKFSFKNFIFYEEITPAVPVYYNENTTFEYIKNNKVFFITKSFTYNVKGMDYSFGINFYKILPKIVKTLTFSLNGNTSQRPFIYSYKLSTSYRLTLFKKKYFYMNINPYILCSKEYNFHIKPAINLSINYDF